MNVALCSETVWAEKPLTEIKGYDFVKLMGGYEHLFTTAKEMGITLIKTNFEWYDSKHKIFNKGWIYEGTWKQVFNFKVDAVWDKSPIREPWLSIKKNYGKKGKILNPLNLELLCSDKSLTDKYFKEFLPKTIIVNNQSDVKRALNSINTKKIVIKTALGAGAQGVRIFTKKEIKTKLLKIKEKTLVQEFIESKKNLFNFTYGVFDLRIVIVNGKIIDSYYRISKRGVLTSNLSTGGKPLFIAPSKLNKEIVGFVKKVDYKLKKFKLRLYTLDILIDENSKPWLLELNTKPGIAHFNSTQGKRRKNFETQILNLFL